MTYSKKDIASLARAQVIAFEAHGKARIKAIQSSKDAKIAYKVYLAAFKAYQTVYHGMINGELT